jgi:hypothetical protein
MGIEVVQGKTSFRVTATHASEFVRTLEEIGLDQYWTILCDTRGDIVDLRLRVASPCEYDDMLVVARFVEKGSYVTLETAWGDDAWRWIFDGESCVEVTVKPGVRAR